MRRQLLDLEDERLAVMDANGVYVHLLSLTAPGVQTLDDGQATALAALVNDRLAEVIARHPQGSAGSPRSRRKILGPRPRRSSARCAS